MRPADNVHTLARHQPLDPHRLGLQTGGDLLLQRDLLDLFIEQSAKLMAALRAADAAAAADLAHKLGGSARAIGALELAAAAAQFDATLLPQKRRAALSYLEAAFARALCAIDAYRRKHLLSPGASPD